MFMSSNIVLLFGSPRMDGNTNSLANAFVEGAASVKKTVTLFRVANMKIGGCLGCNKCFSQNGTCVQKDEMPQILDALREADAVVFASPVYYFSVAAQLKTAIDRMYALNAAKPLIKRTSLLMTCGASEASVADGAVIMYQKTIEYNKWENAGIIIATGVRGEGALNGRVELEQAFKLGVEI